MKPTLFVRSYGIRMLLTDSILYGETETAVFVWNVFSPDLPNLILGQLTIRVGLAAFGDLIPHILRSSAKEEMGRANAFSIIAPMEDAKPLCVLMVNEPGDDVGSVLLRLGCNHSVTTSDTTFNFSRPFPALGGLSDFGPKSRDSKFIGIELAINEENRGLRHYWHYNPN